MSRTTFREALRAALAEALERDPRVVLMGEDVAAYGGAYAVSNGLAERFGRDRVRDTPLSEGGFVGAGIGAALGGPISSLNDHRSSILPPPRQRMMAPQSLAEA